MKSEEFRLKKLRFLHYSLFRVSLRSLKIEQQVKVLYIKCTLAVFFGFCLFTNIRCISSSAAMLHVLHRKEVIQPHLPIRLPCYDLTPIIEPAFGRVPLAVRQRTSGIPNSHGLTGGVYKARERIHRDMLIRDY